MLVFLFAHGGLEVEHLLDKLHGSTWVGSTQLCTKKISVVIQTLREVLSLRSHGYLNLMNEWMKRLFSLVENYYNWEHNEWSIKCT